MRMRSPSARVLINRVDIYAAVVGQDASGAPAFTYPAVTCLNVACSVQAGAVEEMIDEENRVTRHREYIVMFANATHARPRSMIKYKDSTGVVHTLFAQIERDEAGRGAAFTVRATERI